MSKGKVSVHTYIRRHTYTRQRYLHDVSTSQSSSSVCEVCACIQAIKLVCMHTPRTLDKDQEDETFVCMHTPRTHTMKTERSKRRVIPCRVINSCLDNIMKF